MRFWECGFCVGVPADGGFSPAPGADSPTASGPPSLSGRVFFLFGRVGLYPGRWWFLPCAGGGLTHRKRSPLPFREGIFLFGRVGLYPGKWWFQPCAGGGLTHRKRFPLPFREGIFFCSGASGYFRADGGFCPAPGADSPTAIGSPSLSGRVFFLFGGIGVYPGKWWFLPCAGGGLTHRKRSPLPFREGIFSSGALGTFAFPL